MEYVILIILVAAMLGTLIVSRRKPHAGAATPDQGDMTWTEFREWREKARPVPAPYAKPRLPKSDADIGPAGKAAGGSTQVFIRYEDANGNESARRITLRKVERTDYGAYIKAHCHERGAIRHFRSDRIIELVDSATGEVFDDAMDFLTPLYFGADGMATAVEKCAAGVTLLVALGRGDGEFTTEEQSIAGAYIIQSGNIESPDWEWIFKYLRKQKPTSADIRDALVTLRDMDEAEAKLFIMAAKALAERDGVVHKSEQKILDSLYTLFNVEWEA